MFESLAAAHLKLCLTPLNRALQDAVDARTRRSASLDQPDLRGLCVTPDHVASLLDQVNAAHTVEPETAYGLNQAEQALESELRQRATQLGRTLPLDQLIQELGLSTFEREAVLLCAAPELDRAYERIFAYILDDLNRCLPCAELICALTAHDPAKRLMRLDALSAQGRLRRLGLLRALGNATTPGRQELTASESLIGFLVQGRPQVRALFADRDLISPVDRSPLPVNGDPAYLKRLAHSLRAGEALVMGFWGPHQAGAGDQVQALAAASGKPLRRLTLPLTADHEAWSASLRKALSVAAATSALLWLDCDSLGEESRALAELAAEVLGHDRVPLCLTGTHPWRPSALLAGRPYTETTLEVPRYRQRCQMWAEALGADEAHHANDLAARYHLCPSEMALVGQLAQTAKRLPHNGHCLPMDVLLQNACLQVTRRHSARFATSVIPRRGPEDLILPENLFAQVMEIARFHRVTARVDEDWGFAHLRSGRGTNTLFTGESGTGKTLAAEVIAGALRLPLFKVDLARVVSKWVGETEKHLDAVFNEAADCNAVLFFDEADTLFGKRGQIQQGNDRYANLEVGYLLQRLEEHDGLVILASNLKDQIDSAFIRRFQTVIHFPKPGKRERARIWRLALPRESPLAEDIDWAFLEELDLTGAGIAAAARTAALLAADANLPRIEMRHLVQAVGRQYRREDRVLTNMELGRHAHLSRGD